MKFIGTVPASGLSNQAPGVAHRAPLQPTSLPVFYASTSTTLLRSYTRGSDTMALLGAAGVAVKIPHVVPREVQLLRRHVRAVAFLVQRHASDLLTKGQASGLYPRHYQG